MTATTSATIRPARLEDAQALSETATEAWRLGFRGIVPDRIDPRAAWAPERVAARLRGEAGDGSTILVAELAGEVRGLVTLGPSRDRDARRRDGEIVALYVHPDKWRAGIGRMLVEAALDALAASHDEALVWTLAESPRNLAFYEALGFRRDGAIQRRPSFGSPLEVRFRRRLGDREPGSAIGG